MCGISGIIAVDQACCPSDLLRMTRIIGYRGPDDEGYALFNGTDWAVCGGKDTAPASWSYRSPYQPQADMEAPPLQHPQVALGHRRLSILDLSPKGHQPMCDSEQRYWITFNGEVYNYREIRKELEQLGYRFRTDTDTEVIINSYKQWGTDCQHKFNGMWAFALYDRQEKRIFLSRDRFGIKPLYYWVSPQGAFHFGSEIKQFTVCSGWQAKLNYDMAYDYLHYSLTDHTKATLFADVYQIAPGHYFAGTIDQLSRNCMQKLAQKRWYKLPHQIFEGSFQEAQAIFRERFQSAVELHLRADVPVGSALSGGLDSTAIVCCVNALLKQQGREELQKTFSSCSEDKRYDERAWMDEVVRHTQVQGHFVYPKGKDVFTLTETILWHMDEPYQSQSAFLGYHVFAEAKKNSVTVLLNGQGADEYLDCYGDYQLLRMRHMLKSGRWLSLYREILEFPVWHKWIVLKQMLYLELPFACRVAIANRVRKQCRMEKVINRYMLPDSYRKHPYERYCYAKQNLWEISDYQIFVEPLQKYLHWEDRNSMAHSVEARVPFLDYRLVEFTRSLPQEYLEGYRQPKKIVVHALANMLPEAIRQRKDKKGFITPEERWFRQDHANEFLNLFACVADYARGLINKEKELALLRDMQAGKLPFDYSYWRLILFCLWMKRFDVNL